MTARRRRFLASVPVVLALILAVPAVFIEAAAAGRPMALTFDDLPAGGRMGTLAELQEIQAGIVGTLKRRDAPATGFVNEVKLYQDGELLPERVALLETWLAAGFELGNHTFSHPSLYRTPLPSYLENVRDGEQLTRELSRKHGLPYRYFRHPFLNTGRHGAVRRAFEAFLAAEGYQVAPVSVDNGEWIFAFAYDRAQVAGDEDLAARVAAAYVPYMSEKAAYFGRQSEALLGRELSHVLLVHANMLNAHHLDSLLERLQQDGFRFVPLETALEDPAWQTHDGYAGRAGISWLHRWALTRGHRGDFFAGEPMTPQFVLDAAGVDGE